MSNRQHEVLNGAASSDGRSPYRIGREQRKIVHESCRIDGTPRGTY